MRAVNFRLALRALVNLTSPGPKPGSQAVSRIGGADSLFSYPMFRDLARGQTSFTRTAAHRGFGANISYRGHTMSGYGQLVSGSYFEALRLQPAQGRLIGDADDAAWGESPVVVLTDEYWRVRFGGTNVLNDTLVVNGQPMTIVGVTPQGFNGITVGSKPQIFVPITMRGRLEQFDAFDNRRSYWVYLFARLAPGVSKAQAETAGLSPRLVGVAKRRGESACHHDYAAAPKPRHYVSSRRVNIWSARHRFNHRLRIG